MFEEKYTAVIKESGLLLETLLKKIILDYSRKLPFRSRSAINELEIKLGKNNKGIESFELGPLIQIVMAKNVNFFKEISQILNKDQLIINSLNFGYLKDLRNKYTHNIHDASRAEAQYYISSLEILFSFFDVDIYDQKTLVKEIDKLKTENRKLLQEKGKIEKINGSVPYYNQYRKLISNMEYRDTCYYAEDDPFKVSVPNFKELYEKLHYSESSVRKTRIVLNLANMGILPWILLYKFVRDFNYIKQGDIQYRAFYCHSEETKAVYLTHYVLLYNSDEIENGNLMLSLFGSDRERRQKNLIIQNRELFKFMLEGYTELFNSCKKIDISEFIKLFLKIYEKPKSKKDLIEIVSAYFKNVPNSDKDCENAISTWSSIFEL